MIAGSCWSREELLMFMCTEAGLHMKATIWCSWFILCEGCSGTDVLSHSLMREAGVKKKKSQRQLPYFHQTNRVTLKHTVYADTHWYCLDGFCALIYSTHTSYLHYLHTSIYRPSSFCLKMETYFSSTTQRNYCPHINQKRKKKFLQERYYNQLREENSFLVLVLIMCVSSGTIIVLNHSTRVQEFKHGQFIESIWNR